MPVAGVPGVHVAGHAHGVLVRERARSVRQLPDPVELPGTGDQLPVVPVADSEQRVHVGHVVQAVADHQRDEGGVPVPRIRLRRPAAPGPSDAPRVRVRVHAHHPVSGVHVPMGRQLRSAVRARAWLSPPRRRHDNGKRAEY